jgi:hypothetical protein
MSPGSGMSEDERRELIARQRSALYGEGAAFAENGSFLDENGNPRPSTQGSGARQSPLAFERFTGSQNQNGQAEAESQTPTAAQSAGPRSRANSTSSPSSNPTASFNVFENAAQQSSRTSTSSPGGSPPRQGKSAAGSGVAPIGTRPSISGPSQAANPALNKRSTTPLPSPLSYGYAAGEDGKPANGDRSASTSSNQTGSAQDVGLGWGNKSGVWGKGSLGVQASVWG